MTDTTARPRAHLTHDILRRLQHLAVDLDQPVGDLLGEAAVLLLRWHGHSDLPEPTAPPSSESGGK
jgi:hypothetical protein